MMNNLTGLGYGIITFAVLIGVGTVVLSRFGGSTASCVTGYAYNYSVDTCTNLTAPSNTLDPSGSAWSNTNYLMGELGESGLAGWTPAIVAISVGLLFLGAFMLGSGRKGKY